MLLSKSILKLLSDICKDLGIVIFGYSIASPLISGIANIYFAIGGIVICLLFWSVSIYLTIEGDKIL